MVEAGGVIDGPVRIDDAQACAEVLDAIDADGDVQGDLLLCVSGLAGYGELTAPETKAAALIGRGGTRENVAALLNLSDAKLNGAMVKPDFMIVVLAHRMLWAQDTLAKVMRAVDAMSIGSADNAMKVIKTVEQIMDCGSKLVVGAREPSPGHDRQPPADDEQESDESDMDLEDEEPIDVEIYGG